MNSLKIGDFVTGYGSGYWQLIDIKPKIAIDDYTSETVCWKKGQLIGQYAILKKCFTAKMKPRINFSYEDIAWVKPVSANILVEIETYFSEHPEYKQKFDNAPLKLPLSVTNCWFDLPEEQEEAFKACLQKLPEQYSTEEFWMIAKDYTQYISKPPAKYLLNFSTQHPWNLDEKANLLYTDWELIKN